MESQSGFAMGNVFVNVYLIIFFRLWELLEGEPFVMGLYVHDWRGWRTLIGWCTPIENWSTCDAWSWIWRGLVECVFALMKQPWLFLERRLLWKDMWYVKALSCVVTTKTIMIYGTISMGNVVEESFLKTTNDLKLISKRWLHGVMVWVCNILFLVN